MKNEYKITKALMREWAKEYHLDGAKNIFFFILWCGMSIFGIVGFFLCIQIDIYPPITFLYVFIFLMSIYKLLFSRFVIWERRYKLYAKTYGVSEWIRTTEFTDTGIVATDHTSTNKFLYTNVKRIKEMGNLVIILMNNDLALRIYKDAFIEGSWPECKKLILEKKR
jgi:hypothetical protein